MFCLAKAVIFFVLETVVIVSSGTGVVSDGLVGDLVVKLVGGVELDAVVGEVDEVGSFVVCEALEVRKVVIACVIEEFVVFRVGGCVLDFVGTFVVVEGIFNLVVEVVGKVVRLVVLGLVVVVLFVVVLMVVVVLVVVVGRVVVVVGRVVVFGGVCFGGRVGGRGGLNGGLFGGDLGPLFLPPFFFPPPLPLPPSSSPFSPQLLVNPCFAHAAAHSAAVSKAFALPWKTAATTFPVLVKAEVKKSDRKSHPFLPVCLPLKDLPYLMASSTN